MLGWRPKRKRLDASRIDVAGDVATTLLAIARETLDRMGELQVREYEDTASLAESEEYFALTASSIPKLWPEVEAAPVELEDAAEEAAHVADLLRLLENPGARDQILPGQAGEGTFLFYAAVCEDSVGRQVAFIKQAPRLRVARTGRLLTMFSDRLVKIQDPVFSFSNDFDIVIHEDELAVLRAEAYVQLFTDVDVLREAVPGFVSQLASSVSVTLAEDTRLKLEEQCKARPSLAKRLRKLSRKP
jgi:hypothetical protein